MDSEELPELRIRSTRVGEMRILLVILGVCVTLYLSIFAKGSLLTGVPFSWGIVAIAVVGIGFQGLRILIPSTMTLDAKGLTWKITAGPTRRYRWSDIDRFGVIPPRPPLIDPLIGCSFRPGRKPDTARVSWTGYDVTLGSGWELEPKAHVETLNKFLSAAHAVEGI